MSRHSVSSSTSTRGVSALPTLVLVNRFSSSSRVKESDGYMTKYTSVEWFFFSSHKWTELWQDPYWYTSLIIELGFIGLYIAAFISILQIEDLISRVWVYWIFYLIQTLFVAIHTFIYAYYRITRVWADTSLHHAGRINYSLAITWMSVIFSLVMLSIFINMPTTPPCCTSHIPGLTTGPLDVELFVKWYMVATLLFALNFAAAIANYISIQSLMYPERKLSDKEIRSIQTESTRRDKEDKKRPYH